jgi:hypothetical protein
MTKRLHHAIKTVSNNKEVNKEILNLLERMKQESVRQLVAQTNTVDIHRTQGAIANIDMIAQLFAAPEDFDRYFEKE